MKKQMKKMFKRTLIGSAMLMGILVSGGNSASADTNSNVNNILKDSNGNSIVYGQEYYMEPYERPGYFVGFLGELWDKSHSLSSSIKFEKSGTQDEYPESVSIKIATERYNAANGYILKTGKAIWPKDNPDAYNREYFKEGTWVPIDQSGNLDFTTGHYYALKNPYITRSYSVRSRTENISPPAFLSHNGIELVPSLNMDVKAMWRFIPKQ